MYMNNSEPNTTNEVQVQNQPGFFQRVVGIIISPTETMKSLIEKPRILFPILMMFFSIPIFYLLRFSLYQDFLKNTMEAALAQQGQTMDAAQLANLTKISAYVGLGTAGIGQLINWIIVAAIIFAFVKIFKGEGTFKQYLSITGYAGVITLLSLIFSFALSFFTGQLMADASLANITNLFMPGIKGTYLYGVIRGFDLFSIWHIIVMAIGVTLLSRLSKAKVYTLFAFIFIITVLLGAKGLMLL